MRGRDYAYYVSLAAGVVLAAGLAFYGFAGKYYFDVPVCAIYEKTGIYCPGCGGTRAVLAVLRGELLQSLLYHPVVLYTCAMYTLFLVTETGKRLFSCGHPISDRFWKNSIRFGLFLLAGHMAVRNLLKFVFGIYL
jgi:hypothetical protein